MICLQESVGACKGEGLLVRREATNPLDKHAVAIYKEYNYYCRLCPLYIQPGSQTVACLSRGFAVCIHCV